MRTKILNDSFKDISSFSKSKSLVRSNRQRWSATKCVQILSFLHNKRNRIYFSRYKQKVMDHKHKKTILNSIISRNGSENLRLGFLRYREKIGLIRFA